MLAQAAVAVPPLGLWDPSITKKSNTPYPPLLPSAVFSRVLIPSSTAKFELKVLLFRE